VEPGLGIDFGGVIAYGAGANEDHPAELPLDAIKPFPNAFKVIAEMSRLFLGRVWIVSKAGTATECKIREWLKVNRFPERTGVLFRQVYFVRDRTSKLDKCRELGVTHFIDDKIENLETLSAYVTHLYLLGRASANQGVVVAESWTKLGRLLRMSIVGESNARPNSACSWGPLLSRRRPQLMHIVVCKRSVTCLSS
jgi:hypothetical protein